MNFGLTSLRTRRGEQAFDSTALFLDSWVQDSSSAFEISAFWNGAESTVSSHLSTDLIISYGTNDTAIIDQRLARISGWSAAWLWTIVAGIGGLGLLITQGPLPITNGWFALFSGISVCPLTAWLVKRKAGITLSGWTRFAIALRMLMLGRLVLKIEGRGTFLADLSRCRKEGCF